MSYEKPYAQRPRKHRTIRVGPVWDEAKTIADIRGETLTAVILDALNRYVRRNKDLLPDE